MQEVTRQLGPLAEQVGRLSNNVERLYNTNGGPPGYLQTARAEDNGRFQMIFSILEEHKEDIQPIKDFIRNHQNEAALRLSDRESLSKKFDRRLAVYMVILTAIAIFSPHLQGCRKAAVSIIDPPGHSQLQPQVSTIPPLTR